MIVVTGTKRSGTSLWMQILEAAGFDYVGSEFSFDWKNSIGRANARGFYESLLREGIYHRTNPHPKTGRFLFPSRTRSMAVKVFIPGLIRSDYAFLDHVVATIRPWREYQVSLRRLFEIEDAALAHTTRNDGRDPVVEARKNRCPLPPEIEWWFDNYSLIRDITTRRYPYYLVSNNALLRQPLEVVGEVMQFLGSGDIDAGAACVDSSMSTTEASSGDSQHLSSDEIRTFDALYNAVEERQPLGKGLIADLNRVNRHLRSRFPLPDLPTASVPA